MDKKTITIDLDVHRIIEAHRRGFNESENTVLRRLLNLPKAPANPVPSVDSYQKVAEDLGMHRGTSSNINSWRGKGVELPEGTMLRFEHPSYIVVTGCIRHGKWDVEGETFTTPSGATTFAVKKTSGNDVSLNGWLYWQVQRPGETRWIPLNDLRDTLRIGKQNR